MSALLSTLLSNNHDSQIHNAARHPVELDMKQVRAVEARIELDLRIGAAFTRLMTMNLSKQIAELDGKMISYGMFLSCKTLLFLKYIQALVNSPHLDSLSINTNA